MFIPKMYKYSNIFLFHFIIFRTSTLITNPASIHLKPEQSQLRTQRQYAHAPKKQNESFSVLNATCTICDDLWRNTATTPQQPHVEYIWFSSWQASLWLPNSVCAKREESVSSLQLEESIEKRLYTLYWNWMYKCWLIMKKNKGFLRQKKYMSVIFFILFSSTSSFPL